MSRGSSEDQFGQEPVGRIPESLIDAALDGEICDQMQEEIAHALRYDHARRAELLETADAVRALDLNDIPMPDLQCAVLNRLDQHDRFIPRTMRRWVRTGRLAIAAGLLLGLMVIAGLQSMNPRLATIGAQSTPVDDVACAVEEDTQRVATEVQSGVGHVLAKLSPLDGMLATPRTTGAKSFELTVNQQLVQFTDSDLAALNDAGVRADPFGRLQSTRRFPSRGVSMSLVSYGGEHGRLLPSSGASGFVIIRSQRTEPIVRETLRDERIAELP
tara:strand:+ start:76572 stop:77390 length:819 start_codon:yes stop_codon:yes gene_type:complete